MSEQPFLISSLNADTSDPSSLVVTFPFNQEFKNKEIALRQLVMNYSWFSITAAYGNNTCSYIWTNGTTYTITFPDGFYRTSNDNSINDIADYIQTQMLANGHYLLDADSSPVYYINLQVDATYYAILLTCTPVPTSLPLNWTNPATITLNGFTPQFTVTSKFNSIIGFNNGTYPPTFNTLVSYNRLSDIAPQVSPVSVILMTCDLVNSTGLNAASNAIRMITPTVQFGSQIIDSPSRLSFFPINDGLYTKMTIQFLDQNRRPVILRDPTTTVIELIIRDRKTTKP